MHRWMGLCFWAILGGWIWMIRPSSFLHRSTVRTMNRGKILSLVALLLALTLLTGFVMSLSPVWNGENPGHRDQYEKITEAFLAGRLDFGYEPDPALVALENPYDPWAREVYEVQSRWDHAYYQGKYYMYFGVVPVILAFLPYRVITGHALLTWHATLAFTALFYVGMAFAFLFLARQYFPRMTWGAFLSLLAAFALGSALYVAKYPSLYQTPVACGMMLEIWSLFCFFQAFLKQDSRGRTMKWALLGALTGALSFGARPPLALANLLVIPLMIRFLKDCSRPGRLLLRLLPAAIPYAAVAAGLMWYNAARFGNPFEFGQTYQITVTDQTAFRSILTTDNLVRIPANLFNSLFVVPEVSPLFPFLQEGSGAFALCPLLLLSFCFLREGERCALREKGLLSLSGSLMATVLVICVLQTISSPRMLDRYQCDFFWLISLGAFLGAGVRLERGKTPEKVSARLCFFCLGCILLIALTFLIPKNDSFTACDPEALERIWYFLTLRAA